VSAKIVRVIVSMPNRLIANCFNNHPLKHVSVLCLGTKNSRLKRRAARHVQTRTIIRFIDSAKIGAGFRESLACRITQRDRPRADILIVAIVLQINPSTVGDWPGCKGISIMVLRQRACWHWTSPTSP